MPEIDTSANDLVQFGSRTFAASVSVTGMFEEIGGACWSFSFFLSGCTLYLYLSSSLENRDLSHPGVKPGHC